MKKLLIVTTGLVLIGATTWSQVQTQIQKKKLKAMRFAVNISDTKPESLPRPIRSDSRIFTAVSCRNKDGRSYFQGDSGFEACKRDGSR